MTPFLLAVALVASWAPSAKFSLVCTGTQTGYQERGGATVSIPWAETFTIDLTKGTYCSQACADMEPIWAVGATAIDLQPPSPDGSRLVRFTVAGGGFQSRQVSGDGSSNDRFHLEKTGTCIIKL